MTVFPIPMPACRLASALATALILIACTTVTKIPLQWTDPAFQGEPFQKIFVIGVAESDVGRRQFEDSFAAAISERGSSAASSYSRLPETDRLSEERVRQAIAGEDYDAVIVTRVLAIDEQQQYVPPRTYTAPRGHRGYYGYYQTSWDVVHEPGYYTTTTVVRLETNLYDARTAQLVWSGQSETFDPRDTADAIASMTQSVARALAEQHLLGSE
jgi:hypothetical protein